MNVDMLPLNGGLRFFALRPVVIVNFIMSELFECNNGRSPKKLPASPQNAARHSPDTNECTLNFLCLLFLFIFIILFLFESYRCFNLKYISCQKIICLWNSRNFWKNICDQSFDNIFPHIAWNFFALSSETSPLTLKRKKSYTISMTETYKWSNRVSYKK